MRLDHVIDVLGRQRLGRLAAQPQRHGRIDERGKCDPMTLCQLIDRHSSLAASPTGLPPPRIDRAQIRERLELHLHTPLLNSQSAARLRLSVHVEGPSINNPTGLLLLVNVEDRSIRQIHPVVVTAGIDLPDLAELEMPDPRNRPRPAMAGPSVEPPTPLQKINHAVASAGLGTTTC